MMKETLKKNAWWLYFVMYIAGALLTGMWRFQRPMSEEKEEHAFFVSYWGGVGWPVYWAGRAAEWITKP